MPKSLQLSLVGDGAWCGTRGLRIAVHSPRGPQHHAGNGGSDGRCGRAWVGLGAGPPHGAVETASVGRTVGHVVGLMGELHEGLVCDHVSDHVLEHEVPRDEGVQLALLIIVLQELMKNSINQIRVLY